MNDATAVLAKGFQADLEVVLLVSHCDAIAKEYLHIRGPEGVVYRHVRVVWRSQDLVHELLKGKRSNFFFKDAKSPKDRPLENSADTVGPTSSISLSEIKSSSGSVEAF